MSAKIACSLCFGDGCKHCSGTGNEPLTTEGLSRIMERTRRIIVGNKFNEKIQPLRLVADTKTPQK